MVFDADNTMTETNSIKERYDVKGNEVSVKVNLYKGQKEKLFSFN